MGYKAHQGPDDALVPLVGYLGGVTQITEVHTPPSTPFAIDIRAVSVTYAQVIGGVEFGADWDRSFPIASSTNKRVTGWRFQVSVPQGATVDTATVELTHSENRTWSAPDTNLAVGAEQTDTTTAAANVTEANTKSGNIDTTVTWGIDGAFVTDDKSVSPNLASVLQAIVNRPGWVSGNFLTIWAIHNGGGFDGHQVWAIDSEARKPRLQMAGSYT